MMRFRHKKTGGVYTTVTPGEMQTDGWVDSHGWPDSNGDFPPVDMAEVMVYQGEDGRVWVRPIDEFKERFEAFDDGKFEVVA